MHASSFVYRPRLWPALVLPLTFAITGCSDADPEPGEVDTAAMGGSRAGSGAGGAASGAGADGSNAGASGTGGGSSTGGTGTGGGSSTGGTGTGGTGNPGGSAGAGNGGAGDGGLGGAGELGAGPAPVELGTAADYAILAQAAISNVPTSAVTGDVGLSPAAASYVTGFVMTRAGSRWTSPEVTGSIFAADSDPTTPAELTTAIGDMGAAYVDAATRPDPDFLNLGDGAIGGRTLAPGLYNWTSTVTIPSDVTISGTATDRWIFQITGDLTMAAAQRMTLAAGAQAENIVWQVAGEVNLGTTSHAEGVFLSQTAINVGTGASVNGRLLAQTAVALQGSTITEPAQ